MKHLSVCLLLILQNLVPIVWGFSPASYSYKLLSRRLSEYATTTAITKTTRNGRTNLESSSKKATNDEPASSSSSSSSSSSKLQEGNLSASSIYFDIEISGTQIGRLIFHLANPSPLPFHAENIVQLAKGSRRGIDPKAHYVGCEFDYSPASIEDGMGRYRWGHQLKGRGRNAIGRSDQLIIDPENQLKSTHSCFGGQYYGIKYEEINGDPGVLLTVPIVGPGRGSSKFSIVRVGESPQEWGDRLLMNAGVIGRLDPSCLDVLHMMARQRVGPPKVIASGALED